MQTLSQNTTKTFMEMMRDKYKQVFETASSSASSQNSSNTKEHSNLSKYKEMYEYYNSKVESEMQESNKNLLGSNASDELTRNSEQVNDSPNNNNDSNNIDRIAKSTTTHNINDYKFPTIEEYSQDKREYPLVNDHHQSMEYCDFNNVLKFDFTDSSHESIDDKNLKDYDKAPTEQTCYSSNQLIITTNSPRSVDKSQDLCTGLYNTTPEVINPFCDRIPHDHNNSNNSNDGNNSNNSNNNVTIDYSLSSDNNIKASDRIDDNIKDNDNIPYNGLTNPPNEYQVNKAYPYKSTQFIDKSPDNKYHPIQQVGNSNAISGLELLNPDNGFTISHNKIFTSSLEDLINISDYKFLYIHSQWPSYLYDAVNGGNLCTLLMKIDKESYNLHSRCYRLLSKKFTMEVYKKENEQEFYGSEIYHYRIVLEDSPRNALKNADKLEFNDIVFTK